MLRYINHSLYAKIMLTKTPHFCPSLLSFMTTPLVISMLKAAGIFFERGERVPPQNAIFDNIGFSCVSI